MVRLAFILIFISVALRLFFLHDAHLLARCPAMTWYAAHASNKGGTTADLLGTLITANLTSAAVALGNMDCNNAMAPVTKGAAALVPPNVGGLPLTPRLVMPSPGALSPRRPMELPRFE